ncbi:MAG TPA: chromate efflux transporter, partial [Geobacteraceae bacterium]
GDPDMNEAVAVRDEAALENQPRLRTIFTEFLKLGCTAFGGPAIIAHIRELAVVRKNWLDSERFKDGVILSQSIPGATAMQVAAYVGLKTQGVRGAAAAYAGLGLPAFFLMLLLSEFYASSRHMAPIVAVFGGLQVIVVAVVAQAVYSFGREIVRSARSTALAAISAVALMLGAGPFSVIAGSAVAGLLLFRDLVVTAEPAHVRGVSMVKRILLTAGLAAGAGLLILYVVHPELLSLSLLMMRINCFAFGGGLSALPLMHHEIVSRGWMESRAFMDGIALGQVTPGPISITGTFVGYLLFGAGGAIVATIATFFPSFVLLLVSEPYYEQLKSSWTFARASKGVLSCFVGLLVYVTYKFGHDIPWDGARLFLVAAAFLALVRKIDILLVVLVGAIFAVVKF